MSNKDAITPRGEDYSAWYNELIEAGQLAEHSAVRGCMVIRPYGYAIWEHIQRQLDDRIKATGHQNAYFPLFIPKSYLEKEKEHVEGFSPELAVVTIGGGKELEEPIAIRPTSETVINSYFSKWIQSYRDLPVLMNQWANVVRWEMRTRLFLRTAEFLWQEGHTAHIDEADAEQFTLKILATYREFAEQWMAMPVITGRKTDAERFAGALRTYCIEALMQDNKALQAGTSHNLGQNFAKAFQVTFQNQAGGLDYVWNTSWGVSTRLVGALVMTHGDDNGIITPPRLAQYQVVIVPIYKSDEERATVLTAADHVLKELKAAGIRTHLDARDGMKPGAKYYEWEGRGVPLRLEIGPRDVAGGTVMLARRTGGKKQSFPTEGLARTLRLEMDSMQQELLDAARTRREQNSIRGITKASFLDFLERDGGFAYGGWCGDGKCEADIKEQTKATIRCLPDPEFQSEEKPATCMWCGRPATTEAVWARAY